MALATPAARIDSFSDHTLVEIGKQLPDGTIFWVTEGSPHYFPWSTEMGRAEAQDEYKNTLKTIGIVPTTANRLKFVTRERVITFTEATPIVEGK